VTPACIGQKVAVREEVDSGELTIAWAGRPIGAHALAPPRSPDVWDPAHRASAEAAALARTRPALQVVRDAPVTPRPADPYASYDVETPDLAVRYGEA
ncbi:MAG: hypothetical protein ACRDYY_15015, partial [Acidimicrobiales bacterium]